MHKSYPATISLEINNSLIKTSLMNDDHMEKGKKYSFKAAIESLLYAAQAI